MTTAQLHIMRHAVGLDDSGRPREGSEPFYRNRYVVGPGCDGFTDCQELCKFGLMKDHGAQPVADGMHFFSVTDLGKSALMENQPVEKKLTKAQQMYRDFLRFDGSMRFIEYVKWKTKLRKEQQ